MAWVRDWPRTVVVAYIDVLRSLGDDPVLTMPITPWLTQRMNGGAQLSLPLPLPLPFSSFWS